MELASSSNAARCATETALSWCAGMRSSSQLRRAAPSWRSMHACATGRFHNRARSMRNSSTRAPSRASAESASISSPLL